MNKRMFFLLTIVCFGLYETAAQNCLDPTNIKASENCNSATLSWDSDVNILRSTIQWGNAGFTLGNGNLEYSALSPFNLTGLSITTGYDFYVLDSCNGGGVSNWVGPINFTTDSLPHSFFNASQNASTHPDTIQFGFSALLSKNADNYWWDYGDGSPNDTDVFTIHDYVQNGNYTVKLVVSNACGVDTSTQVIVVAGISIQESELSLFKIYPNPAKNYIIIDFKPSQKSFEWSLTDVKGSIVMAGVKEAHTNNLELNVSSLLPGSYIFQAEGATQKIVIQQ